MTQIRMLWIPGKQSVLNNVAVPTSRWKVHHQELLRLNKHFKFNSSTSYIYVSGLLVWYYYKIGIKRKIAYYIGKRNNILNFDNFASILHINIYELSWDFGLPRPVVKSLTTFGGYFWHFVVELTNAFMDTIDTIGK